MNKDNDKEKKVDKFTRNKFLKFVEFLSQKFFQKNKKALDAMLKEIFTERSVTKVGMNGEPHRVMLFDDMNKRLITEIPI